MDLQKQAPVEEEFLRADAQTRLARAAAEQAATRSRARRKSEAAASLLRALRSSGQPLDADLEAALERGTPEALSEGFRRLSSRTSTPTASTDLAGRLREDGPASTLAGWLARQLAPLVDPAIERIDARLAELSQELAAETVERLRTRLDQAADAPAVRRGLLLDGLEVETGQALTAARRRRTLATALRLLLAELTAAGLPTEEASADMDGEESSVLEARVSSSREALETHRGAEAAAARRAAVLEGLAGLGYEVTEGMTTSLAQDGRLVLRSATRPDYGVEVSAVPGAERMQMRAVAFETGGMGPDPARDRDAETIWCGDVSTLQGSLAAVGAGLSVEKALPVGAVPLKRIPVAGRTAAATAEAPVLRERTLR